MQDDMFSLTPFVPPSPPSLEPRSPVLPLSFVLSIFVACFRSSYTVPQCSHPRCIQVIHPLSVDFCKDPRTLLCPSHR